MYTYIYEIPIAFITLRLTNKCVFSFVRRYSTKNEISSFTSNYLVCNSTTRESRAFSVKVCT